MHILNKGVSKNSHGERQAAARRPEISFLRALNGRPYKDEFMKYCHFTIAWTQALERMTAFGIAAPMTGEEH